MFIRMQNAVPARGVWYLQSPNPLFRRAVCAIVCRFLLKTQLRGHGERSNGVGAAALAVMREIWAGRRNNGVNRRIILFAWC
jgi:hypothetical protein